MAACRDSLEREVCLSHLIWFGRKVVRENSELTHHASDKVMAALLCTDPMYLMLFTDLDGMYMPLEAYTPRHIEAMKCLAPGQIYVITGGEAAKMYT